MSFNATISRGLHTLCSQKKKKKKYHGKDSAFLKWRVFPFRSLETQFVQDSLITTASGFRCVDFGLFLFDGGDILI